MSAIPASDLPVIEPTKKSKKSFVRRKRPKPDLPWRRIVQGSFAVFNVVIGIQFYRFVHAGLEPGTGDLPYRPPGVEGWLPISGLMGILDWIHRGSLNLIHPAATVIILAVLVSALLLRKSFCAWLCPVGLISEYLAKLGRILFRRNVKPPRWLDYPLIGIKYMLLGFFLWSFVIMGYEGIAAFLDSPYNRVSDVKMLLFFEKIGTLGLSIIGVLMLGSIIIEGFWCRYLCPYGALLGLFSMPSPVKVRRNADSCFDCGKCDRVCPSRLPVMSKLTIVSAECTGCMNCVEACPVEDALYMGTRKRKLSRLQVGALALGILIVFTLSARMLGYWDSSLSDSEYRFHMQRLETPKYGHPGS